MIFPTLRRREKEAPWRTVSPIEVGEGGLDLWGPGGKANQEPEYSLIRGLEIRGSWSPSVPFSPLKNYQVL